MPRAFAAKAEEIGGCLCDLIVVVQTLTLIPCKAFGVCLRLQIGIGRKLYYLTGTFGARPLIKDL